jgi:hypothetical protein
LLRRRSHLTLVSVNSFNATTSFSQTATFVEVEQQMMRRCLE